MDAGEPPAMKFSPIWEVSMPIRLSRFEMPRQVKKDEATATGTYTRFVTEPF